MVKLFPASVLAALQRFPGFQLIRPTQSMHREACVSQDPKAFRKPFGSAGKSFSRSRCLDFDQDGIFGTTFYMPPG